MEEKLSLKHKASSPRFYPTSPLFSMQGCKINVGRCRPEFEASKTVTTSYISASLIHSLSPLNVIQCKICTAEWKLWDSLVPVQVINRIVVSKMKAVTSPVGC